MSTSSAPTLSATDAVPRGLMKRVLARLPARVALVVIGLYVLAGLIPWIGAIPRFPQQYSPLQLAGERAVQSEDSYSPPSVASFGRWFGTEIAGRPVIWRLMCGANVALTLAVCASLLTLMIGLIFGLLAGYFGGWVDALIMWLVTTISSIPWVLLLLAMVYALRNVPILPPEVVGGERRPLGPLAIIIIALGLTDWVGLCRLVRGQTLQLRSRDYISAAVAMGAGTPRIIFRHILPGVWHLVIITSSLGVIAYVQAEVVMTFLGLGVTDQPSWGRMIDDAKLELLRGVWWQFAAATAAVGILCLALNILGDALRDALDVRR